MPDISTNTTPQLEPESGKIFVRIIISATKPVALELTESYAVTGSGDPSYVSGAQAWNGTTELFKPLPAKLNIALTNVAGEVERFITNKT